MDESSVLTRPGPPPAATSAYGEHPDQVIDLRPARGGAVTPRGTIVVIHGGFWRPAYDRTHAAHEAQALADNGFNVAVLEYRRAPGDWPAMAADVLAGLAHAREQFEDRRLVLVGHSAGGHLAAWAAHQDRQVSGVVALAGCLDLHLTHELGLGDGAAAAMMGSTPDQDPAAWAAADPARLGTPPCPLIALHGDRDDRVPLQVSQAYADRLGPGGGVQLRVLAGVGHYALIDPLHPVFAQVLSATSELAAAGPARELG